MSIGQYPRLRENYRDLPEWNRRGASAINYILRTLTTIELIRQEESILYNATGMGAIGNNATIAPYDSNFPIEETAAIQADETTGIITVGYDGWYEISGYYTGTGSNNNAYYGVRINAAGLTFYLGAIQWDNNNPLMIFGNDTKFPLQAGDQVFAEVFASTGTLTFTQARLDVSMVTPL